MPQTTTAITACDVNVWLDDSSGTATDISGSTNQVTLNFDMNVESLHTFGSRWPIRFDCGKDASFTLGVVYTTASDEALDLLRDWFFADTPGNRTLSIYVPKKNVGNDRYQCEAVVSNLNIPMTAGDANPIAVSITLLPNGAVTHSTVAT